MSPSPFPPNTPTFATDPAFSVNALLLITEAEGLDQPGQWPGGASGITIGRGDDLGYQSAAEFGEKWRPLLADADFVLLLDAIGFKGQAAREIAHRFSGIHITVEQADQVFQRHDLPRYVRTTAAAFPGIERLPLDAQGALVSLVYNRGGGMEGDSRQEMRAIRDELAKTNPQLSVVANELRSMKRIWVGRNEDGLLTRREAEAQLIERAG